MPLELTEAIEESELRQVNVLSVASEGVIVAVSFLLSPIPSMTLDGLTLTPVTGIFDGGDVGAGVGVDVGFCVGVGVGVSVGVGFGVGFGVGVGVGVGVVVGFGVGVGVGVGVGFGVGVGVGVVVGLGVGVGDGVGVGVCLGLPATASRRSTGDQSLILLPLALSEISSGKLLSGVRSEILLLLIFSC